MNKTKIGVILSNLGTPDEPTPPAISRYLWQFLTDPRVVDLPKYRWYPLLKWIILPSRSKRVAKNYESIWSKQGSPLLTITLQQKQGLQDYFVKQYPELDVEIEIGMTYGNPSMESAVEKLLAKQVNKLVVLPLYPQYSSTTTAAVFDAFAKALSKQRKMLPFHFIHSYHLNADYISALVESIQPSLQHDEFVLFSFHGIPLRYEKSGDYYREHCLETSSLVANQLGLSHTQWKMSFQSRFGREEWLQPYTDKFLENAAQGNIKKIVVVCPGFSADCLETLEEIEEENREIFLQNGGETYRYIPALNADENHIEMMAKLILEKC